MEQNVNFFYSPVVNLFIYYKSNMELTKKLNTK